MTNTDKEILFHEFLKSWKDDFESAIAFVRYIFGYYLLNDIYDDLELINPDDMVQSQKEWIALVLQMQHPEEKDFFAKYWVPICSNSFKYFIDISKKPFEIFKVNHFELFPHDYYKVKLADCVPDFLNILDLDNNQDVLTRYLKRQSDIQLTEMRQRRQSLGTAGYIPVVCSDFSEILDKNKSDFKRTKNTLLLKGVSPRITYLFPENMEMSNVKGLQWDFINNVKNIKGLNFLLNEYSKFEGIRFSFKIKGVSGAYVQFSDNQLRIQHPDKDFISNLVSKFEKVRINLGK